MDGLRQGNKPKFSFPMFGPDRTLLRDSWFGSLELYTEEDMRLSLSYLMMKNINKSCFQIIQGPIG